MRLRHIALHVRDVSAAEEFYRSAFDMEVVTRETYSTDEGWQQLQADIGWDDAARRSIPIGMVALRRDDLVLAFFSGSPTPGALYLIGIHATSEEIAEVRSRLTDKVTVEADAQHAMTFVDPFGVRWQLSASQFRGSGAARGAWFET